jgi:hypothetical protein
MGKNPFGKTMKTMSLGDDPTKLAKFAKLEHLSVFRYESSLYGPI